MALFLAHHLRERVSDPNLRWWQLAQAVPRSVLTDLVVGAVAGLGALFGLALGAVLPFTGQRPDVGDLWVPLLLGAVAGYLLGALAGLHAGRAAHPPQHGQPALGIVGSVLGDLGVIVVTLCLMLSGIALAMLAHYVVAAPAAVETAVDLRMIAMGQVEKDTLLGAVFVGIVAVGIVAVTNGLGAGRTGMPRRAVPRARDVPSSLAAGLGIGLLFGLLAAGAMWLLKSDWVAALGIGLMIAVVTGVPVGLGRWLSAPADEAAASSPESVLRGDRTALLLTAGGVGMCTFAIFFVISGKVDLAAWILSTLIGSGTAIVVLFGSGASWLSYTVARLWLALCGKLPWRLTRFLRHAHAAGVLRQAGPAYQIRHDLLRIYLADRYRPPMRRYFRVVTATDPDGTEPRATPPRRWRWRWRWRTAVGATVALTMLPAAIAFVEPDTQPWVTFPHSGVVDTMVFHPDGTILTAAGYDSSGNTGKIPIRTQWHLPDGPRTVHRFDSGVEIYDSALSPYGTLVTVDDGVRLWGAAGGPAVHLHSPPDLSSPPEPCDPAFPSSDSAITRVAISADGRNVVTRSEQGLAAAVAGSHRW